MNAKELYERIDGDFEIGRFKDDWAGFVEFNEFVAPGFQERTIGVMLDNAAEIEKVYTAVFPDMAILDEILGRDETDVLLLSHHAMGYDPTREGFPFYNIPVDILRRLKERRIAFYVLHVPLDRNGPYSTSMNLAKALQLPVAGEFCEYRGCKVGVICETSFTTLADLAAHVKKAMGHKIKVLTYGDEAIAGRRVAVAAGGGCIDFVARELSELGVNTLLTGVTKPSPDFHPSVEFHRLAREGKINVVGATHYSTEKYACIALLDYLAQLGIEGEFVRGAPCMEDL